MDLTEFSTQMRALIDSAVAKARDADGLTWAEAGQLFVQFVQLAVEAATGLRLDGAGKKQAVLLAIGELFDAIAPYIPLPWYLAPLRSVLIAKLRQVVLAIASGGIEAVYYWLKKRFPDHFQTA